MPLPSGLTFTDRIAIHDAGIYFLCRRRGHRKCWKRFTREGDAKEFRAAHDTAWHNTAVRIAGFEPARNIRIDVLCKEWLAHIGQLEIEGRRSPDTTRFYDLCCTHLVDACRELGIRTALELEPSKISQLVRWFRANTDTAGALIVKSLSALKTMIRWKGLRADWTIPHDEIRAERRPKRELDTSTIQRLVSAMPVGSIEEACAYLKARTGARDVEIYRARREEFELDLVIEIAGRIEHVGIFRPVLHNKGRGSRKRHVYVITSDAVAKVRPFVESAVAGGFVFRQASGRPMDRAAMRPRIQAAAKAAGFIAKKRDNAKPNPVNVGAIDTLAQIRSEVLTIVHEETSPELAAKHSGHATPSTLERWYVKDRLTQRKLAERFRPAEIIAKAIPLRAEAVN